TFATAPLRRGRADRKFCAVDSPPWWSFEPNSLTILRQRYCGPSPYHTKRRRRECLSVSSPCHQSKHSIVPYPCTANQVFAATHAAAHTTGLIVPTTRDFGTFWILIRGTSNCAALRTSTA